MGIDHKHWMNLALDCAREAEQAGEVPVGAVLVYDNQLIAKAHNQPISLNDPTAHAEIQVIRDAGRILGNYRLVDTNLYVTLQPCTMCWGAMVHARIKNCFYGATDPKAGLPNHQIQTQSGICEKACSELLKAFFRSRR